MGRFPAARQCCRRARSDAVPTGTFQRDVGETWGFGMSRWLLGGVLGAVVLATAAGCTSDVPGTAVNAAPVVIGIRSFGDTATLDPCGLVDLGPIHAVLGTQLELDQCTITVPVSAGQTITVNIGPLGTPAERAPAQPIRPAQGGMTLEHVVGSDPNQCADELVFGDRSALAFVGLADDGPVDPCAATETVMADVAARVARGKLPHLTYPAGSAGEIDPCGLVGPAALTAAGITDPVTSGFPERHQCYWASRDRNDTARLTFVFAVGPVPTILVPSTDSERTIDGFASVVRNDSGSGRSYCEIDAGLNAYLGGDTFEVAALRYDGGTAISGAQICGRLTVLAAAAFTGLPPVDN